MSLVKNLQFPAEMAADVRNAITECTLWDAQQTYWYQNNSHSSCTCFSHSHVPFVEWNLVSKISFDSTTS